MNDLSDTDNETADIPDADRPTEQSAYEPASRFDRERTENLPESPDRQRFPFVSLAIFLAGFAFVALVVIVAYIYLLQPESSRRFRFLNEDETSQSGASRPAPSPSATPPFHNVALKSDLPITADMLHVTSIALGDIHLAIVNGTRLAEGEWLKLKVGNDFGAVRITKIEDGVVHFAYGDKTIDSKLIVQPKPKPVH